MKSFRTCLSLKKYLLPTSNLAERIVTFCESVKKKSLVGKGEKTGFLFPQGFQNALSLGLSNVKS